MRTRQTFLFLAASIFSCALAYGQSPPSVADAARQSRQQKQQVESQAGPSQDAGASDSQPAKTPKVITNDDIPEHVADVPPVHDSQGSTISPSQPVSATHKLSAEQWKSQIMTQKRAIATLQRQIANVKASIHFPEGCSTNTCAQRNERQLAKEDRVDLMQHQLEQQQKHLEELQDAARRQGYGSSVYEP